MKLEKAIEILGREVHDITLSPDPDVPEALNLGIEALKLNKTMRETYAHPELLVLPGETTK